MIMMRALILILCNLCANKCSV